MPVMLFLYLPTGICAKEATRLRPELAVITLTTAMSLRKVFGQPIQGVIHLEEPKLRFYTKSDSVKGSLIVDVTRRTAIRDVVVKLQCVETSAVSVNQEDRQSHIINTENGFSGKVIPPLSSTESKLHWEEVQEFLPPDQDDISPKRELQKGKYTYLFSFNIPDLDKIPGSAFINAQNGLEFGITWRVKAVIHRPGLALKRKFTTTIPVYTDIPRILNIQERGTLTGTRDFFVHGKPSPSGLIHAEDELSEDMREPLRVSFDATFPTTVPQSPLSLHLTLKLSCSRRGMIFLRDIRINLIQRCNARANHLMDTYVNKYEIGYFVEQRLICEDVIDLTPRVKKMGLAAPFPPNFRTSLLQWSYELEVEINFAKFNSVRDYEETERLSSSIPIVLGSFAASTKEYEAMKKSNFVMAEPVPMMLDFRLPQKDRSLEVPRRTASTRKPVFDPPALTATKSRNDSSSSGAGAFPSTYPNEKILCDEELDAPLRIVTDLIVSNSSWYKNFFADDKNNSNLSGAFSFEERARGKKSRCYEYIKSLNGRIGPKSTRCLSTDTLETFDPESNVYVLTATRTPDVPSGDAFVTMSRICLARIENNRTKIRFSSWIDWNGRSFLKAAIEKGAFNGQVEHSRLFVNYVRKSTGESERIIEQEPLKSHPGLSKFHLFTAILLALIFFVIIYVKI